MGNVVRKLRPNNLWRIGEMESWFSDMSAQGLHVKKIGALFVHFIKGEPVRREYRLEFAMKRGLSDEQRALYEDCGWIFVDTAYDIHVFVSDDEKPLMEIHTDPAEQGYTLDYLQKKMRKQLSIIAVLLLATVIMYYFTWFLDGVPIYHLVEGYSNSSILTMTIVLISVLLTLQSYLSLRKIRNQLAAGIPIDHHAPWQSYVYRSKVFTICYLTMALLFMFFPIMSLIKMQDYPLPETDEGLPFVRLADIEEEGTVNRYEHEFDGRDLGNHYYTNWSIFAPTQFDTSESGVYPDSLDSASLSTDYYELSVAFLVEPFLQQLMKRRIYDETLPVEKLSHPAFEQLYVQRDGSYFSIFIAKGNVVTHVDYSGNMPLEKVLDGIADRLNGAQ